MKAPVLGRCGVWAVDEEGRGGAEAKREAGSGWDRRLCSSSLDGVQVKDLRKGGGRAPQWDVPARAWGTAVTVPGKSAWCLMPHTGFRAQPPGPSFPQAQLVLGALLGVALSVGLVGSAGRCQAFPEHQTWRVPGPQTSEEEVGGQGSRPQLVRRAALHRRVGLDGTLQVGC